MRAMRIHELGGPLSLDRDAPVPTPGPGEVLIRVAACGVNFADTLLAKGRYQLKAAPPFAPGMEVCGTIEAVGEGASLAPGARVAAACGWGGFAEYVTAPAAACVTPPAAMSDEDAAAFQIAYGTADVALNHRAGLKTGETLCVLGAGGGVGLTGVEIGALTGARVIAVARGAEKAALIRTRGAAEVLDVAPADLKQALRDRGGIDVLYDPVGGAAFDAALRATRPEGRLLPLGFASGDVPQIPANILLVKNLAVHGFWWGGYAGFAPDVLGDSARRLFGWWEAGRLKPHVGHVLPLEDAAEALRLLTSREAIGKVVVRP